MVKKAFAFTLILISTLLFTPTAFAADYTLIISDVDVMSEQQAVVFNEQNIAPGFNKNYEIKIENRTSKWARVRLDKIQKITPTDPNLAEAIEMRLSYDKANVSIATGKYNESEFINREMVCVADKSNDTVSLSLSLPDTATNEYQGDSFILSFSFKVDGERCTTPGLPNNLNSPKPPNADSLLPHTGQNHTLFTILCIIIGVSSVITIILLIVILLARHRDKEGGTRKNDSRQNTTRQKTKGQKDR